MLDRRSDKALQSGPFPKGAFSKNLCLLKSVTKLFSFGPGGQIKQEGLHWTVTDSRFGGDDSRKFDRLLEENVGMIREMRNFG